jgi:FtsP/CotA-like multicopper oxidase with cupredoxin domain
MLCGRRDIRIPFRRDFRISAHLAPKIGTPAATQELEIVMPDTHAPEPPEGAHEATDQARREWMLIGLASVALIAVIGTIIAIAAFASSQSGGTAPKAVASASQSAPAHKHAMASMNAPAATTAAAEDPAPAPKIDDAKGVDFEPYEWVDPTLPPVPEGDVKTFTVDVAEHVVQVDPALAPTDAWTYAVDGKVYRGTAASPPMVVNQGDKVAVKFVNGGTKEMHVTMAHSIDLHSAEVAPSKYYVDIKPGEAEWIRFTADHAGVFMYHCATQPVLMHVGNGMSGMMVVKPRDLPAVDRELWVTQAEYYLGEPGAPADMTKLMAEKPDVIAFNGYANQYKTKPIEVKRGERIRLYVLNTGPSKWSAFHVIGTIFDQVHSDNGEATDVQTINLAPSQGAWAEFTLDQEGNYPFLTHSFGDMMKGAVGVLRTEGAPDTEEGEAPPATKAVAATPAPERVPVRLADGGVQADSTTVDAGHVTFAVRNAGSAARQFAIVKGPVEMIKGSLAPETVVATGRMLGGGATGRVHAHLAAGKYRLVCLTAGRYPAGRQLDLRVH